MVIYTIARKTASNGPSLISNTALRHSRALRWKDAPGTHSLQCNLRKRPLR